MTGGGPSGIERRGQNPPKIRGWIEVMYDQLVKELLLYPPAHVMSGGLEADGLAAAAPISVEEPEWAVASLVAAMLA